jgi:hypothetical protein
MVFFLLLLLLNQTVHVSKRYLSRHYDVLKNIRETERKGRRRQLSHIINAVLRNNEELHYYQVEVTHVFLGGLVLMYP